MEYWKRHFRTCSGGHNEFPPTYRNLFMLLYLNRTYDHIAALPKRCLYVGLIYTQQSNTPTLQYSGNMASPEPIICDLPRGKICNIGKE
jgi:hypothetical protein